MADRLNPPVNAGPKPTPVKLYASWEIDRTPPNCIPRVCTLTLTKLVLLKPLGNDLTSLVIAVKVQSSKRILRSNEVILPGTENILERELALSFSFQYPHFLKREGNKLQILLQRRKRYKNRTMLGFKTLAVGTVGMAEALQKPIDEELELYTDLKEKTSIVAKMTMVSLLSQPVDHDAKQKEGATVIEAGDRVGENYSDEEEDFTSNEEGSDSEPTLEDGRRNHRRSLGVDREINLPSGAAARQRNLKQKFISLLKRFKVTDEDHEIEEIEQKSEHEGMDPQDIEDLFDELEDLSDSGPDMDTVSIMSTPKPSLRPFFPSSRSLIQEGLSVDKAGTDRLSDESSKKADSDGHPDQLTDHEQSDPPAITSSPPTVEEKKISSDKRPKLFTRDKTTAKEKRISLSKGSVERSNSVCHFDSSPRKVLLEQLGRVFPTEDSTPDYIILVNVLEIQGQVIAQRLTEKQYRVLTTAANADVRATISFLVSRIQKFCNTNSKAPLPIKVVIIGSDGYVNSVVRTYVEQLSSKPPEWQSYIKFLIIPVGVNNLAKYLGSMDSTYHTMFLEPIWRDAIEKPETQKTESQEIVNRISRYINNIASVHQLPIAEAMITYKEKSSDEDSSQIFVPFVSEVRIGATDTSAPTSVDLDEMNTMSSFQSSSPPAISQLDKPKEGNSPPSSPSIGIPLQPAQNSQIFLPMSQEPLELQIDYWTNQSKSDSNKKVDSNKNTLKSTFKSLQFMRLPLQGETSAALSMNYVSKEKKQKIMRLGKKKEKDKESEPKSTLVEGINRLICLTRSQPLKVNIDGTDWYGVKFFQLSAQWQTHIKHFPVALFMPSESAL